MHSRTHVGDSSIACPWCQDGFTTASGLTIHLESGKCQRSGLNVQKINKMVQQADRHHVITKPMITYESDELIATDNSWNGNMYECYLCHKEFHSLGALNQHMKSPAHMQSIYRCPKGSCRREYKTLSALVQHVESESCGIMRFAHVQQQARNGMQNMIGKMIKG